MVSSEPADLPVSPNQDKDKLIADLQARIAQLTDENKDVESQLLQFIQAVEQGPVAVIITDLQGNIEYVNSKFEQITGYSQAEAIGLNPRFLQSGETPAQQYEDLWQVIASGGEWKGVFRNRKKSGELFWERAVIAPVKDASGEYTHYVAVKEDITAQRQVEKQMEEEKLKFFHQSKMADLGLLSASILHEVGNPISSIYGLIADLLSGAEDSSLDTHARENLELVLGLTERLMGITREIAEFSSPQPGKLELLDLNGVIRASSQIVQFDKRWGKINLTLDLDHQLPAMEGFKDQLSHLMVNLLVNAADAIGEIDSRRPTVSVKTHTSDGRVHLKVSDNGCGMTPEVRANATEAFFTTKMPGKGTGLGLSLCQSIVESHHGQLSIKSLPDVGTDMEISFPLERPEED